MSDEQECAAAQSKGLAHRVHDRRLRRSGSQGRDTLSCEEHHAVRH